MVRFEKKTKYSEILKINTELGSNIKSNIYDITILSNITINQIKEMLEYTLRIENINAKVRVGDYDNVVQDSLKYRDSNSVFIFWEICNLIDGLQYKIELFNKNDFNELLEKTESEIDLVLNNLQNTSLVLFNKFSSFSFSNSSLRKNNSDRLADQLNQYLEMKIPGNVRLVDLEKVIANVGVEKSLDLRYYYSSKALYTIDFFKAYAASVKPFLMSANGKAKKALIFDCDNTLWKGILGEDGFNNIEMSAKTKDGEIFYEIQNIALSLNKQGILLGLCSKNNLTDVDEVIKSHPDMKLRDKHITIKKINWSDKVSNLQNMAKELNLSLESFVFVDDSAFEVNLIKEQLPEITVLQVPNRLYEYPILLRENFGLFYNFSLTEEDKKKIVMYKQQVEREVVKKEFTDIEDYLASLELKMKVHEDDESLIPRMAQMSQKTNQFNLTTIRYTEADIKNLVKKDNFRVFAFSVSDKFGESGTTGLCIIKLDKDSQHAFIDTFLMSCRIIGRNIEYAFMDFLIDKLKNNKINSVEAKYVKSKKNEQVSELYDNCLFTLIESNDTINNYELNLVNYKPKKLKYIEVKNGK